MLALDFQDHLSLARKLKQSPQALAEQIVSKVVIPADSLIANAEAKNGYVNFGFDYSKLSLHILKTIADLGESYGSSDLGKDRRVIVEFPSVNPGKPWHVGHARNAVIGDAVQRILRFSGFEVESQNYINELASY